jgi:hypothetical protein
LSWYFLYAWHWTSTFIVSYVDIHLSQDHLLSVYSSPHWVVLISMLKINWHKYLSLFLDSQFIQFCLFLYQYHSLDHYSFKEVLKRGRVSPLGRYSTTWVTPPVQGESSNFELFSRLLWLFRAPYNSIPIWR